MRPSPLLSSALSLLLLFTVSIPDASGQWTNRYPKVDGYAHHVYLEGFELPILTSGPMDPAPSPDGDRVALAARGWIWLLDPTTGVAQQVTSGRGMDARPAWSPDGTQLAFVRDDTEDTQIVIRTLNTGDERVIGSPDALDLDPSFSADGTHLFYASAKAGDIDVWRLNLRDGTETRLTSREGLERAPQPTPDGRGVVYLQKSLLGPDAVVHLPLNADGTPGTPTPLTEERIASQADVALAPDGRTVAYVWPHEDGFELRLLNREMPGSSVRLARGTTRPLSPAVSADGKHVWFAVPTPTHSTALRRVPLAGGPVETIEVQAWDWANVTGTLRIRTQIDGTPVAARLNVRDANGHPAVPDAGMIRFDGQNGRVFFYSPGVLEVTMPPGKVTVSAVQGLRTKEARAEMVVLSGQTSEVTVRLDPVWDDGYDGWAAADDHFHLNYGGPYQLGPEDLALDARGEGMDVLSPLVANLHDRFLSQDLWGYDDAPGAPIVQFGQEVRSHFLGHVKLLGTDDLFWPWVWGPYYEVYANDDRPNAEALRHAQAQGGAGGYVHPVSVPDPFADGNGGSIPIGLIPDAVLGAVDLLEVGCLWTDELGTSALWHRLLNLGLPVRASAGSDVMTNYYRTMAIGATRTYVRTDGPLTYDSHLDALKAGRSVVTNGPMLTLTMKDGGPGDVVDWGRANWNLRVDTPVPVDSVELIVNGEVVRQMDGPTEAGTELYSGGLILPEGGWVTARAYGGEAAWPVMDSYPFAETGPVWIESVGSTDPEAKRKAAQELLRVLDVAEERMHDGYGDTPIPTLQQHVDEARAVLEEAAAGEDE